MFIVIVPGTSVSNSTTNEAGALTAVVRPSRKVVTSKGSICNVVVMKKIGDTGPIKVHLDSNTGITLTFCLFFAGVELQVFLKCQSVRVCESRRARVVVPVPIELILIV